MDILKNSEYPTLETERLDLRILSLENSVEVFHHFSDEAVTKFMDIEPCKDIHEAEEIITYHLEDSGCRWGVFHKEDKRLIGTAGYHYLRKGEDCFIAEVGFDLASQYWGKGYMTESMNEVLYFGFGEMGLTKIDATVEQGNEKSIKLMEKLGFNRDLELKDNLIYFYLTKNDYEAKHE